MVTAFEIDDMQSKAQASALEIWDNEGGNQDRALATESDNAVGARLAGRMRHHPSIPRLYAPPKGTTGSWRRVTQV